MRKDYVPRRRYYGRGLVKAESLWPVFILCDGTVYFAYYYYGGLSWGRSGRVAFTG